MGEMADYTLEDGMDDWDAITDYHTGKMTDAEAYDRGIIDELGFESKESKMVAHKASSAESVREKKSK